jgi:hypothetical protein
MVNCELVSLADAVVNSGDGDGDHCMWLAYRLATLGMIFGWPTFTKRLLQHLLSCDDYNTLTPSIRAWIQSLYNIASAHCSITIVSTSTSTSPSLVTEESIHLIEAINDLYYASQLLEVVKRSNESEQTPFTFQSVYLMIHTQMVRTLYNLINFVYHEMPSSDCAIVFPELSQRALNIATEFATLSHHYQEICETFCDLDYSSLVVLDTYKLLCEVLTLSISVLIAQNNRYVICTFLPLFLSQNYKVSNNRYLAPSSFESSFLNIDNSICYENSQNDYIQLITLIV